MHMDHHMDTHMDTHMDMHTDHHMDPHMENRNRNRNKDRNESEKGGTGEKPKWAENFKNYHPGIIYPFEFPEFAAKWDLWIAYRAELRIKAYKHIGEQAALKELSEMSAGNVGTAIAIINQSISKNWRGLFELDDNKQNGRQTINPNLSDRVGQARLRVFGKPGNYPNPAN